MDATDGNKDFEVTEIQTNLDVDNTVPDGSDNEIEIRIENCDNVEFINIKYVDDIPGKMSQDQFAQEYREMYGKVWQKCGEQFLCLICRKHLKHCSTLFHHIGLHLDNKPYKCNYCQKSFTNNAALQKHGKMKHPYEYGYMLSCPYCKKYYKTDRAYLNHMTFEANYRQN